MHLVVFHFASCKIENGDFCYILMSGQLFCIDSMGRTIYSVSTGEGRFSKDTFASGTYFWVHLVDDNKYIYPWVIGY
jgi:hypothetical protein